MRPIPSLLALSLLLAPAASVTAADATTAAPLTIEQVMERILSEVANRDLAGQ